MIDVTPSPITSMSDLLARLDFLLSVVSEKCVCGDRDAKLSIAVRIREVADCVTVIDGSHDEWCTVKLKLKLINEIVERNAVNELEQAYLSD